MFATELVRLNGSASAVVVGNPQIADVSVHSDRTLFVVGRSFGETNIIVMDGAGDVIMNANVQVTSSLPVNGVRVYNGTHANRSTFNCSPYCLPAPVLGDNPEFIITNQNDVPAINNQIAGQTSTGVTPYILDSQGPAIFGARVLHIVNDVSLLDIKYFYVRYRRKRSTARVDGIKREKNYILQNQFFKPI